ncbi:MAG: zinc-binding dehydrogenase [Thermoleophilaceae bacterium]
MRAVVIGEDRALSVQEVEQPQPAEGQVRVRVEACGICGSDIHMRPAVEQLPAGAVMGHEFAGVVDAAGPGVAGLDSGDRVCVFPFAPLDHHDLEAAMTTGLGLGQHPGGYAESIVVDAEMVWRLPDEVELEHGALVEPFAVALHGLDVGETRPEDPCAVVGAGPIGVMCALALRARGVERVVVVEPNEGRRARIEGLGFEAAGLEGAHETVLGALGAPPAAVFECAGHPSAPQLAIELVAPSGRVVLLGVLEEPVEISQLLLILKEAQLRASFAYRPSDFDAAIELIAGGKLPAEELITARAPLEDAEAMFMDLESGSTEQLKVLLRP